MADGSDLESNSAHAATAEAEARFIVTHVLGHGDLSPEDEASVAEVARRLRAMLSEAELRGAQRMRESVDEHCGAGTERCAPWVDRGRQCSDCPKHLGGEPDLVLELPPLTRRRAVVLGRTTLPDTIDIEDDDECGHEDEDGMVCAGPSCCPHHTQQP